VSSNPQPPHGPHRLPRPAQHPSRPGTSPASQQIPSADNSGQLLYTPAEAAELLRVRESWLRRRAAARQIPCTFLGKHLRFSAADLAGIVAQNGQAPTGRRPRRRPASTASTVRDSDLPTPRARSVDPPDRHDHNREQGSSPWHG
jgi:excisionase family DNA binding protein